MGKTRSKDTVVDSLRIVATLLVVFGHCSFYKITTNYSTMGIDWSLAIVDQTKFMSLMNILTGLVYSCHMELFMFISGMVFGYCMLNDKYPVFGGMVRTKTKRLLVPYLTVTVLYNIPILIASSYIKGGNAKELLEYIFLYFVGFGKNHLWYLPALFVITILSYALYRVISRLDHGGVINWSIIICLFGVRCISPFRMWEGLYIDRIVEYFVWFALGRMLYGYREPINRVLSKAKLLYAAGLCAVWLMMFYAYQKTGLAIFEMLTALSGIAFFYAAVLCICNAIAGWSVIHLLSEKSMAIYLYGVPINYLLITVLLKVQPSVVMTEVESAVLFCARFVLQILGALLIDYFVQRCKTVVLRRAAM